MKIFAFAVVFGMATSLFTYTCGFVSEPDDDRPNGGGNVIIPERTLAEVWDSVLNGDKRRLDELTSQPPSDWMFGCTSLESPPAGQKKVENSGLVVQTNDNANLNVISVPAKSEDDGLFLSNNVSEDVRRFAQFVHASRISWSRIKIVETSSINDEALLRIIVLPRDGDTSSAPSYALAFFRRDDRYRLIGVVETGVFGFVDNQLLFASPSSRCSEKKQTK